MVASPSFAHLIRDTAKLVLHPTVAGSTLWDARNDRGKLYGNLSDEAIVQLNAEMDAKVADDGLSSIEPLGSGSDFTVFLQRIGVRLPEILLTPLGSDLYSPRSPVQASGLIQPRRMLCITTTRYLIRNAGWKYMETPVLPNMYVLPH